MIAPPVICIDPGHPSEVGVGTRGKTVTEVELCQRVADGLKRLLDGDGYTVVLTKDRVSRFVANRDRAEIANRSRASLLVRLHCDATGGSGFAVYRPDRQGKAADGTVGPSRAVLAASDRAARRFHPALVKAWAGWNRNRGLKTDRDTAVGARQGALTGSIHSKVPVILVEMVVLTNPADEAKVAKGSDGIARLVRGLAAAIRATVPREESRGSVSSKNGTAKV